MRLFSSCVRSRSFPFPNKEENARRQNTYEKIHTIELHMNLILKFSCELQGKRSYKIKKHVDVLLPVKVFTHYLIVGKNIIIFWTTSKNTHTPSFLIIAHPCFHTQKETNKIIAIQKAHSVIGV